MLANDLLRPQVTKRILSALQFHLTANAWYVNAARHLELGLFCVLNSQLLIPLTCSVTMFSSLCLLHQYLDRPLHFIPFPTHFLGDNYQYISPIFCCKDLTFSVVSSQRIRCVAGGDDVAR
jgi:hypothetical protein